MYNLCDKSSSKYVQFVWHMYNLCDMSENALDGVKTPKSALSHKLYIQIGFVTQIVHIWKRLLGPENVEISTFLGFWGCFSVCTISVTYFYSEWGRKKIILYVSIKEVKVCHTNCTYLKTTFFAERNRHDLFHPRWQSRNHLRNRSRHDRVQMSTRDSGMHQYPEDRSGWTHTSGTS